ncbi:MAG: DUF4469 domain-containing protein [Spirochaetaceae bacterium]|nr:DUF4469 domain-containing protein [Spirochaetaceae bacterium]
MAALIEAVKKRLHCIRVWAYRNFLDKIKGMFFFRTEVEAMVTIEETSAAAVENSGGKLDYETMVTYVKHFIDEGMHQMCDGFGLNLHYFSLHPAVTGTTDSPHEKVKPEDRRIAVKFREREPLRELMKTVEIEVVGIAESGAYIDEFFDVDSGSTNEKATPGGQFIIKCAKGRIDGDGDDTGIIFKSVGEVPSIKTKVQKKLAKNDPSELIGTLPDLPAGKTWEMYIRTRYTHGGTPLKEARDIKAGFTLST